MSGNHLIIGSKKGLIVYSKKANRWSHIATHFLGIPVSAFLRDSRTGFWWAALNHGHWGIKLHLSKDEGLNWSEIEAPKFPDGSEFKEGVPAKVQDIFCIQEGAKEEVGTVWIGTRPGALFKTEDGGKSFQLNEALWNLPSRQNPNQWFGGGWDEPIIHSIEIHPENRDHIYIGISVAGVFMTKDGGKTWEAKNKGCVVTFLPEREPEIGHDPHRLLMVKSQPEVLWQQNHCGVFKTISGAEQWELASKEGEAAHFGFAIVPDEINTEEAWIVPAISDETRVAVDQQLRVFHTTDSGKTWTSKSKGLPKDSSFDLVYRHALDKKEDTIAFGTTTGNLYLSENRGEQWHVISSNLPLINVVTFI